MLLAGIHKRFRFSAYAVIPTYIVINILIIIPNPRSRSKKNTELISGNSLFIYTESHGASVFANTKANNTLSANKDTSEKLSSPDNSLTRFFHNLKQIFLLF